MLELVTTVLECLGFALILAGVGVVVAVLVGGGLGLGAGLVASGGTALVLSAAALAAGRRVEREGRRAR